MKVVLTLHWGGQRPLNLPVNTGFHLIEGDLKRPFFLF